MSVHEINFDGLVGPTHNYAGLAPGNLLSTEHAGSVAHPRAAALQGLEKMRRVADLGIRQLVFPPHPRPDMDVLRRCGFTGDDDVVLATAAREDPALLSASASASGMWTANAATVSPSSDTGDARVHVTPANLMTLFHRVIEADWTTRFLRLACRDEELIKVHDPLQGGFPFADEGAANHTRFACGHANPGVELFVWGRVGIASAMGGDAPSSGPRRFQGRQTREASQAIARRHGLDPARVVFARQSQEAIDAGAFHNDVVAVGNEHVLLYHDQAFDETDRVLGELRSMLAACPGSEPFLPLCVRKEELSLEEATKCYLFNSQLLSLPGKPGSMLLLAPSDCEEHPRARRVLDRLLGEDNPIDQVEYIDVRQSMRNGGGPACLRLRMVLTERELDSIDPRVILDDRLHSELVDWVGRNYREELAPESLAEHALLEESGRAFAELARIMPLPGAE